MPRVYSACYKTNAKEVATQRQLFRKILNLQVMQLSRHEPQDLTLFADCVVVVCLEELVSLKAPTNEIYLEKVVGLINSRVSSLGLKIEVPESVGKGAKTTSKSAQKQ